jgi:predicted TIM-barrel fold metal-dependent hydrolase
MNASTLSCIDTCCTTRRGILGGMLALGGASLLGARSVMAQSQAQTPQRQLQPARRAQAHRIDVHHHFNTPRWVAAVATRERLNPRARDWTAAQSIEEMDRNGVATSMLSITNPGLWFGDAEATRSLTRDCNDHLAGFVRDHPGRFGSFAAMPLPDVDATLREIAYAMDELKCDGVGLFTSYADKWLGDPAFNPVYEELNRRKALVFVHPTAPNCCGNLIPDVPASLIEYGTDTTRAIASLLFTGTAARYPDIRFVFSHAGGTAPYLILRFQRLERTMKEREKRLPKGLMHELQKFHYDTALATSPVTLGALLKIVPVTQVLFGTDFPSGGNMVDGVKGLAECGFSAVDLSAIERDNARRLLPRLA